MNKAKRDSLVAQIRVKKCHPENHQNRKKEKKLEMMVRIPTLLVNLEKMKTETAMEEMMVMEELATYLRSLVDP